MRFLRGTWSAADSRFPFLGPIPTACPPRSRIHYVKRAPIKVLLSVIPRFIAFVNAISSWLAVAFAGRAVLIMLLPRDSVHSTSFAPMLDERIFSMADLYVSLRDRAFLIARDSSTLRSARFPIKEPTLASPTLSSIIIPITLRITINPLTTSTIFPGVSAL